MDNKSVSHVDLQAIAKQVMLENGFEPEFPPPAQQQLSQLQAHPPRVAADGNIPDLRNLLWPSIYIDTSRHLDHLVFPHRQPHLQTNTLFDITHLITFT